MSHSVVNINGKIKISTKPLYEDGDLNINVMDRGFIYGDSLYEVMRTYNGTPFGLTEHIDRLFQSAKLAHMQLKLKKEEIKNQIQSTVSAYYSQLDSSQNEVYCRIVVTRGSGNFGFALDAIKTECNFVIYVLPLSLFASSLTTGVKLQVSSRIRNDARALDPAMKSGNYLNNLLAYLEAREVGFDDCLLCNVDGHITEGTTFNIFYIKNNILVTPPLDIGILDGISRKIILKLAKNFSLEMREVRFTKERLYEADEVFISSSLKEAFPVAQIDSHKINRATPGKLTLKIKEAFHQYALLQCKNIGTKC